MQGKRHIDRRNMLFATGAMVVGLDAVAAAAADTGRIKPGDGIQSRVYDQVTTEWVMNLVVTCSAMEPTTNEPPMPGKDGIRSEIWPIIGGHFWGTGIKGQVCSGGADYPVMRPDGVEYVDALYRLKTDDGVSIVIHNKGLGYPAKGDQPARYRLLPEFFAPAGKYEWLNKSAFVSTLVYPVPPELALTTVPNANDRLIQVFRLI